MSPKPPRRQPGNCQQTVGRLVTATVDWPGPTSPIHCDCELPVIAARGACRETIGLTRPTCRSERSRHPHPLSPSHAPWLARSRDRPGSLTQLIARIHLTDSLVGETDTAVHQLGSGKPVLRDVAHRACNEPGSRVHGSGELRRLLRERREAEVLHGCDGGDWDL